MKRDLSRTIWRQFRPTRYDLLRIAILILIAIALVSRHLMRSSILQVSAAQAIDLLEILALVAPILWVDSARKLALAVLVMFLTRLGFTSVRCLIEHEYLYSVGFAAVCIACTLSFVRSLRNWASVPGPKGEV
jgi:hypothetical protein